MTLMVILYFTIAPTVFYDPPWLILIGNTVFVGIIGFLVAGIAWRNYLSTGRLQVLFLGCGVLLFAIGGVLAAVVRGLPGGANLNVTIYNTGALLGAVFHFAAALILLAGLAPEVGARRRNLWLALGYGGSVLFMALLTAASLKQLIPPFFIQGVGPTLLRQQVLGAADLLFVFSCLVFLGTYYRNRETFLYWYAGGLGLTAISLTGFLIQHSVGSPVGWVGRFSQYLGGVYFLVALLTAARNAETRGTSLDDVLATSLTGAEEKFRSAFANAAIGFAMTTPTGRFVDANAAYCAILGYSIEELRALDFAQLIHPDDRAANVRQVEQMLSGEIADFTIENRYLRKSGQPLWVRKSASLVRDAQGSPRWMVALIEDITERRQAEAALRESEERLRTAIAGSQGAEWQIPADATQEHGFGEAADLSPQCKRCIGFADEEFPNSVSAWRQRIHPDDLPAITSAARAHSEQQTPFYRVEYRIRHKDGSWRHLFSTGRLQRDADGRPLRWVGLDWDITERKRAEEALRQAYEQRQLALDAAELGTWDYRFDRGEVFWDERCRLLFGIGIGEKIEYDGALACIHPDDRAGVHEAVTSAIAGANGGIYHRVFRVVWPDGSVHWVDSHGRVHFAGEGDHRKAVRLIGVNVDITEHKRALEMVIRSEKVAALGRMAAGLAHDINNPLSAVMNTLFLARSNAKCAECTDSVRPYLEVADEELKRVSHIAQQALGFYREGSTPTKVALRTIVDETVDMFRSKIKSKNVRVEKQYEGEIVEVVGIGGELRQAFSNLFANSLDAIGQDGIIKLRVTSSPDMRVRITIADNGKGIEPADIPRIFEPLFTTKGHLGTGLGLWVTKQLIDKHGGSIRVRSSVNGRHRGTTFSVVLPSATAAREQAAAVTA